jgi:type I restriction enzyme M protein
MRVKTNMSLGGVLVGGAMGDPGSSTARDETATARSEAIISELFGPLADRVRGTGSHGAYINLLLSSVFLRGCARSSWADVREDLRKSVDAQSDPRQLLQIIGRRTDTALRKHGLPPGISSTLDDLRGDAIEDLAHVIRLCEDLGPKDFSAVLDRFGARLGTHDESFFTPRAVVHLIVQMLNGNLTETARIHDPYMRGGELLAGALEVGGFIALSGSSPSKDMLRLAGMNILLNGGHADLRRGTIVPSNQPATRQVDLILTNPPFNNKGSPAIDVLGEDWIFEPPPRHNRNYAWIQHILVSLKPAGKAIVLMPNQAAVSVDTQEHLIRKRMIQEGAVEFIIALPRQLFATTAVPAMIWGLRSPLGRADSVLFIDIRQAGTKQGKQRVLDPAETRAVASCLRLWRAGAEDFTSVMQDIGKAAAASIEEIRGQDYSLDPSDYLAAQLLDLDHQALAAIPELAAAVELRAQQALMADKKAAATISEYREMDEESSPHYWRRTQIGEICVMKTGPSHSLVKKAARADDGVPLIVPSNLRDHRILAAGAERINAEVAWAMERFQIKKGDILFVRTGSVGPVALVTSVEERWLFGTNLIRIRCHEDIDPGYLLAYLSSRPAQKWIQARTESATAIPSISADSLKKLPVNLPPLDEQRRVSDLLAKADMQITAHRALSDTAVDLRTLLTDGLTSGRLITNLPLRGDDVTTSPPSQAATIRLMLTAIAFLIGVIAALIAGILQQAGHRPMPQTIEYSCGAFAATVIFVFSVFSFIGERKTSSN